MRDVLNKVVRWIIFGVFVALVPLAFSYLNLLIKDKHPTIEAITDDGGLLLIISALCAGAIGELIGTGEKALFAKVLASGGSVIVLLLSASEFASITQGKNVTDFNHHGVATISLWLFGVGLLPCLGCIALSEV